MTTIKELELSAEIELEQAIKKRDRALAEQRTILATARAEGRPRLSEDEDRDIEAARKRYAQAKGDVKGVEEKLAQIRQAKADEEEIEADLQTRDGSKAVRLPAKYDEVARVGAEERTYHKGNDRKGGAFIRDVTRSFLFRDVEAEGRLARHMQEERVERSKYLTRAAGTGAFAGLTVPQYLTDMYAPATAAQRPFANVCNHHDLPESGMTVNISRITTSTSAALQASENSAVSETNIDDTLLTENIQTAAGQQTLSRQAIERGTGVEEVVMDDLFRRYATVLDLTLLSQATTGLAAVSTAQSFTTATPTIAQQYGQIIGAASTVETNMLGFAQPDTVVMHPRRWYAFLSAVSNTYPSLLAQPMGPIAQSTGESANAVYGTSVRGVLANGLKVIVDANVSTVCLATALTGGTQDQIYVTTAQECHLWEDPAAPVFLRAEQTAAASLGVLLVLYGYFAYSFRRYSGSVVQIEGSGLVPPVFSGTGA
jgi:hypothetical protein